MNQNVYQKKDKWGGKEIGDRGWGGYFKGGLSKERTNQSVVN